MKHRYTRPAMAAALMFLALTAAPTDAGAERIPLRAETADASVLLTFGWTDPVSYQKSQNGREVTIRFSRPIDGPFAAALRPVADVVTRAEVGPDGRSVVLTLARDAEVFAFYTGTAVTVEVLPTSGSEAAPPSAGTAAAPVTEGDGGTVRVETPVAGSRRQITEAQAVPADAPAVGIRTGVHPDYTRVVLDFETETPYRVDTVDGVVTLQADRAVRLNVGALSGRDIRWLGDVRTDVRDGQTSLLLAVPPTSEVRNFVTGAKIVLDIRQPTGSDAPATLPPDGPPPAPVIETETAAAPAAPAPPAPVASALEAPAETETAAESSRLVAAVPQALQQPINPGVTPPPVAEQERPRALVPVIGTTPPPAAPPPAFPAEEPIDTPAREAVPARASAEPGDDRLAFRFDFDEPVAAATFRRGGAIWIVFDTPLTVDTAALQAEAGEGAFEILQVPSRDATVLRIRTSRRYNPAVQRDGLAWIIDFAERPLTAQSALEVEAQPTSPVGPRLFISVPEPGRPIGVLDPNIGDNFVVVPVIPLGQAIGRGYTFPQFTLANAAQGVVINPMIDDLRVRSLRQGVEISSSGVNMAISNVSADAAAHAQLAASRPMVKALEDLESYYAPVPQLRAQQRRLQAQVADAPEQTKTAARMQLARFYFANAYAAEALAVLRIALEAVPLLENDPSFRVMRGGSNFLMGRYDEALPDFIHESTAGNDEALMWAAATTAMQGDRIGSARDLRFTGSIARDYPRPLKMPLGILIAEVAAETGDGQGARLFLEALNLENPTADEQAMLQFAEGKLRELDGDFEGAIALWEQAAESDNRPTRARARVALTEMLLRLDRINLREAIEAYEQLRFAWRGDKMEFDNLRRLGSLYLDEGFYREGLSTLKEAATHFRELPEAPAITEQMSDSFNALFLGDQAREIDPVKAIAIYNEFKELTPAGPSGDEMIRNLTDKLVEVDLLDRAADLLSAQVQFRLEGVQKAQVGARLALIHSLANEYQNALDVLDATQEPDLPPDLTVQRRHLRARTLMGLDRNEDALALLEEDQSEAAELLRTEVYWNNGRWLEASRSLRFLVRLSGADPEVPLTELQAARIMNYVIALTNSGGERAVAQVKNEYAAAMTETTYAEAFQLVTTPSAVGVLDPNAVQRKVAEAETFLAAYRDKLKQGVPLSSIN